MGHQQAARQGGYLPAWPFRLTPRDRAFYGMFTEAGQNVADCADILAGLLDPNANREAIAKQLREREHAGDSVTHRIMRQLNTSFVTPFDREDIYRLAVGTRRRRRRDGGGRRLHRAGRRRQAARADGRADHPARQVGPRDGRRDGPAGTLRDLEPYWIEVNRLENEADRVYRKLLSGCSAATTTR